MQQDEICSKCAGKLVMDYNAGERICSGCGLVVEERIESDQPTSAQGVQRDSLSGGIATKYYDLKASSLTRHYQKKDANGNKLSNRQHFERLKNIDRLATSGVKAKARALENGSKFIEKLTAVLRLQSNVREHAIYMFNKAVGQKLTKGRSIPTIAGACVFYAAKNSGTLRSISEIKSAMESLGYQSTNKSFNTSKVAVQQGLGIESQTAEMPGLVSRVSGMISINMNQSLSQRTIRTAAQIVDIVKRNNSSHGKNPLAITATAFYIASIICNEQIIHGQNSFALAAGISVVTLRKRAKDVVEILLSHPDYSDIVVRFPYLQRYLS
jgi:transcription initiation factor TFIIB